VLRFITAFCQGVYNVSNGEAVGGVYIKGDTAITTALRAKRDIEAKSNMGSQKLDQKSTVRDSKFQLNPSG
jgi:hypothetical protein